MLHDNVKLTLLFSLMIPSAYFMPLVPDASPDWQSSVTSTVQHDIEVGPLYDHIPDPLDDIAMSNGLGHHSAGSFGTTPVVDPEYMYDIDLVKPSPDVIVEVNVNHNRPDEDDNRDDSSSDRDDEEVGTAKDSGTDQITSDDQSGSEKGNENEVDDSKKDSNDADDNSDDDNDEDEDEDDDEAGEIDRADEAAEIDEEEAEDEEEKVEDEADAEEEGEATGEPDEDDEDETDDEVGRKRRRRQMPSFISKPFSLFGNLMSQAQSGFSNMVSSESPKRGVSGDDDEISESM